MKYSNLHTHTVFSDGANTPLEMVERAVELGFVSIGFSDHSETPTFSEECMPEVRYGEYAREVRGLAERFEDRISVFCGIEKDILSQIPWELFDYIIGSVHYLTTPDGFSPIDYSLKKQMEYIEVFGKGDKLEYAKRYYEAVAEHAQKSPFQIQGHFDLLNKFGLFDDPDETYVSVALEALDEVLKTVPFIEVNTGAISRGYRTQPYPEDFLLRRILERGGRLVLNGDSHRAEHLDCHYDQSIEMLKKMGFSSIWQLQREGFTEVCI
ncbi:MAG: histidinol-phosphatase [Clostridia bacterium]|nr:histidinol-phosphatase [Clostridia bacterium]